MARKTVVTATMFKYKRRAPKTPFLGWGYTAVRKSRTIATSPRLLSFRGCIAGKLAGKTGTLLDIQTAFRDIAPKCSTEAKAKPTVLKPRRID